MKKLMIAAMMMGGLMVAQPAQAGVVDSLKGAGTWAWNLLPGALTVANKGIHFGYKIVHGGVHNLAEFLKIEVEEPTTE